MSFKKPETLRTKTLQGLVAMVLVIIVLATEPQVTFFAVTLCYILSAPVQTLYSFLRHGKVNQSQKDIH